jgi:conserved hypothetical protein TIGR00149
MAAIMQSSHGISVATCGQGFYEITGELAAWLGSIRARDGLLTVFIAHTSASLTIQENADPAVREDLLGALARFAPESGIYAHAEEGPDDMPAHIKSMLTSVSLSIPVVAGRLALGTWQGVFMIEHRRAAYRRRILLTYIGSHA